MIVMYLPDKDAKNADQSGQTLVEFALVIPMLMVLLMAVLEMGLALNASLAVNRASQEGAHIAATAGNIAGTDCLILDAVERDMGAPNKTANISEVIIDNAPLVGNVPGGMQQHWTRSGSTNCTHPDGTVAAVPYTLVTAGYPEAQRCTILGGCPTLTPPRSTVDNIGVTVRYRHDWVTPLNGSLDLLVPGGTGGGGGGSGGWNFEQRNVFRIEPTL